MRSCSLLQRDYLEDDIARVPLLPPPELSKLMGGIELMYTLRTGSSLLRAGLESF